jgi:hypothetical protein
VSDPFCRQCRQPLGGHHTPECIWMHQVVPSECTGVIAEAYSTLREKWEAEKVAEGRRLATAAIVADLRARASGPVEPEEHSLLTALADRYERGEHEGSGT